MARKIDDMSCVSCGSCQSECPVDCIMEGAPYSIDPDKCIDCGACEAACPVGAIHEA